MKAGKARHTPSLAQRLSEAESAIDALTNQIAAIANSKDKAAALLSKTQEALRKSEEGLRHERERAERYLDTAAIILALDLDGRITLVNRYACSMLGWTAEELLGRDWIETCLPARIRNTFRKDLRGLIGGNLSISENPILTKSGEERLIEWRNTVLRDDAGQVAGTFSAGADITDRSRAVEALLASEERMRLALEASGVGIWDMDCASGQVRWSEILESQYSLHKGTFGGTLQAFMDRIHTDDREPVLKTIEKAMKLGADFSVLSRSIWPDGTVRWLSGAGRFLLSPTGKPLRGVGISRDVTERKGAEATLVQNEAGKAAVLDSVLDCIIDISLTASAMTDSSGRVPGTLAIARTDRKKSEAEFKRHNDEIQLQRLRVFKATIRTVQDMVNNLLNGLQLVHLEADRQTPAEMQIRVEREIQEVAGKLKTLGDLETVKEREMAIGLGIDYPGAGS